MVYLLEFCLIVVIQGDFLIVPLFSTEMKKRQLAKETLKNEKLIWLTHKHFFHLSTERGSLFKKFTLKISFQHSQDRVNISPWSSEEPVQGES